MAFTSAVAANTVSQFSSVAQLAAEFRESRCVVIADAVPLDIVRRFRDRSAELVRQFGVEIRRTSGEHHLHYRVVTGEVIQEQFPELFDFYASEKSRDWICEITGEKQILTSNHLQSAVNINSLDNPGQRYRWHFDAVPYTALLYLTDGSQEDGGALEVYPNLRKLVPEGDPPAGLLNAMEPLRIYPKAGTMVVMDGSRCYHSVAPLKWRCQRLSVPMVYPPSQHCLRPEALDEYLYKC
jgi:hypothetical protein